MNKVKKFKKIALETLFSFRIVMGIRRLKKFLTERFENKYNSNCVRYFDSVKEFAERESIRIYGNKTTKLIIGIDVSIFITRYKFHSNNVEPAFFKQIVSSITAGLYPIFVFDGKPPASKDDTIRKRQKVMEKNTNELNELRAKIQNHEFVSSRIMKMNDDLNYEPYNTPENNLFERCSSPPIVGQSHESQDSDDDWGESSDVVLVPQSSLDVDYQSQESSWFPNGGLDNLNLEPAWRPTGVDPIMMNLIKESRDYPIEQLWKQSPENGNSFDEIMSQNYHNLLNELERKKKKVRKPSFTDVTNLKLFFDFLHIPYLTANGEAENLIAELYQQNIIHACLSEDTDVLPKGCGNLIQINSVNSKHKYKVTQFILSEILIELNLSYNQFVDFCIILGCDYYVNYVFTDDPHKAYEIFMKYPSIYQFAEYYKKMDKEIIKHVNQLENTRKEFIETGEKLTEEVKKFKPNNDTYYKMFDADDIFNYFNNNGIIYDKLYKSWCSNSVLSVNRKLRER